MRCDWSILVSVCAVSEVFVLDANILWDLMRRRRRHMCIESMLSWFTYPFQREYLFNLNGAPLGSYEEASALFGSRRGGSSRRRDNHEPVGSVRRSKRRPIKEKEMGSNVSRHSGKGLSGRRAQSSGSLCKILAPRVGRVLNPCGDGGVRRRDRNKFSGSLPNRLDDKDGGSRDSTPPDTIYSNYGELYGQKNVELLLHKLLPQKDLVGGDQGYDSPDDELPPDNFRHSRHSSFVRNSTELKFITKENTFEARLEKGSRGLGLSVTGGVDTAEHFPGLIRIKRIFPHQPAWECGNLDLGDIILEANGVPLTGLTNHEALEVLRTTPSEVTLKVCRPPSELFPLPPPSSSSEPPPPPRRNPSHRHPPLSSQSSNSSSNVLPLPLEPFGEFEVTLIKVNGSLGFTLRKEDESVLGHYVRALVREPALSDGRIQPGDKIVSVNGADISSMSHEDAVSFLRQCGEEVKLRIYRDPAQTPVSALSPTESHRTFRPKPALRKEAMDMLCDLAVRKFTPSDDTSSRSRLRSNSPGSSPRRRRLTKVPSEEDNRIPPNVDNPPSEPASMPPIPTTSSEFSHKNPVYQSAHPTVHAEGGDDDRLSDQNIPDTVFRERGGSQGLLKWKGVVFTHEDDGGKVKDQQSSSKDQVLTVELCRGWNSRLGFSLQSSDSATLISAIYPDSVAAKDGRLQSGDEVIMINDEPTKNMKTSEVIDLLRRVRGTIAITVVRSS